MRALIIVPLCLVAAAACSGGEEKKADEAAATLEAGQWEVVSEVTEFRSTDKATPALKAAKGDKVTSAACIEEGDKAKPKAELFAGAGYECKYKNSYIKNGRINASVSCERDALEGEIMMSIQGTYTGTTFEGTVDTISYLSGEGDFAMNSRMSGRKTAPACAPEAVSDDKAKGKKAG
jgi:hypothetical protein